MTYGESKKITMALIDEYDSTHQFTDDDAEAKLPLLYSLAYSQIANIRTRLKSKEIEVAQGEGREQVKLPKCRQRKEIYAVDGNNNKITVDWYQRGEYIFVSKEVACKMIIVYEPYLERITETTPDSFELELDDDLQDLLSYRVASDLFKTDPSQNWTAFETVYNNMLQQVNRGTDSIMAMVEEGEDI
jgi:hypothetical protein